MSHAISRKDAHVPAAIHRIAAAEITATLAVLESTELPLAERIHKGRKTVKHLRGLIRMVRPVFPGYATANAALRDAGREIAALRDAQVALWTFDALAKAAALPEAKTAPLRAGLEATLQQAQDPDLLARQIAAFTARMQDLRDGVAGWKIKRNGFDALEEGLSRSLKAARADEMDARAKPEAETVHDWRKRVKDHWYQARFLLPIWPEMMQPQIDAAGELGEILGEYQDISVLSALLPNGRTAEALVKAGRARQGALLGAAHPLSRRLFADPPAALAARWRVWWQVWRST